MLTLLLALYLFVGLIVSLRRIRTFPSDSGTRNIEFMTDTQAALKLVLLTLTWPAHVWR